MRSVSSKLGMCKNADPMQRSFVVICMCKKRLWGAAILLFNDIIVA